MNWRLSLLVGSVSYTLPTGRLAVDFYLFIEIFRSYWSPVAKPNTHKNFLKLPEWKVASLKTHQSLGQTLRLLLLVSGHQSLVASRYPKVVACISTLTVILQTMAAHTIGSTSSITIARQSEKSFKSHAITAMGSDVVSQKQTASRNECTSMLNRLFTAIFNQQKCACLPLNFQDFACTFQISTRRLLCQRP